MKTVIYEIDCDDVRKAIVEILDAAGSVAKKHGLLAYVELEHITLIACDEDSPVSRICATEIYAHDDPDDIVYACGLLGIEPETCGVRVYRAKDLGISWSLLGEHLEEEQEKLLKSVGLDPNKIWRITDDSTDDSTAYLMNVDPAVTEPVAMYLEFCRDPKQQIVDAYEEWLWNHRDCYVNETTKQALILDNIERETNMTQRGFPW